MVLVGKLTAVAMITNRFAHFFERLWNVYHWEFEWTMGTMREAEQ